MWYLTSSMCCGCKWKKITVHVCDWIGHNRWQNSPLNRKGETGNTTKSLEETEPHDEVKTARRCVTLRTTTHDSIVTLEIEPSG